jgi:hypothetical protein
LLSLKAFCQIANLGAEGYSRGNAMVASKNHLGAIYYNPAGLTSINNSFLAATYFRLVPVAGFNTVGLNFKSKIKAVHIGTYVDSFGDTDYHENNLGVALAFKKDRVSIGAKMASTNQKVSNLSNTFGLISELGMLTELNSKVRIGLKVNNYRYFKTLKNANPPTLIALGSEIDLAEKLSINTQIDHYLGTQTEFRMGMTYRIKEFLSLNSGISPKRKTMHFGCSLNLKPYVFQIGTSNTAGLGFSNQISLFRILGK